MDQVTILKIIFDGMCTHRILTVLIDQPRAFQDKGTALLAEVKGMDPSPKSMDLSLVCLYAPSEVTAIPGIHERGRAVRHGARSLGSLDSNGPTALLRVSRSYEAAVPDRSLDGERQRPFRLTWGIIVSATSNLPPLIKIVRMYLLSTGCATEFAARGLNQSTGRLRNPPHSMTHIPLAHGRLDDWRPARRTPCPKSSSAGGRS
ncbi:hypothetical protein P152DRAFT_511056 [Eremomyces bilateralis CBS 781.70]|uniref:Uncharacterized protein n=1 Tax=Eremomyces bilateralis CBS 781.70 TaxID=1392243 RepID=A0A6G1GDS8_9PEZI|nr:uncharacterized protein P152DRAFT_511056 [Eremomyces bilateralis CBS 781.70]KAF1816247.1 hypothetical protein P152DRAFT_511056 [Eremomyces bilateralis CBS 781.70]